MAREELWRVRGWDAKLKGTDETAAVCWPGTGAWCAWWVSVTPSARTFVYEVPGTALGAGRTPMDMTD